MIRAVSDRRFFVVPVAQNRRPSFSSTSNNTLPSGIASPKICGELKFLILANNPILFRKRPLKVQNDYIFLNFFWGTWPIWPPLATPITLPAQIR